MNQDERDELLIRMDENIKGVRKVVGDHEERLRGLERVKWMLWGAWAVVSALFGWHTTKH